MPRYWAIAPYNAGEPELWEKVWKYDLDHGVISIGWNKLGDVSSLSESQLRESVDRTYPDNPPAGKAYICRVFRNFYHSIKPGDLVIARRGLSKIAAIGTVTRAAYYEKNKNAVALGSDKKAHSNYLDVQWTDTPRNQAFDKQKFGMQVLTEILEERFKALIQNEASAGPISVVSGEGVQNEAEFVLEKYLEEFMVSNFNAIFKGKLRLYSEPSEETDPNEWALGQQFETDVGTIDILAQEIPSNAFVVIELKKGRESDKVVGQVLRYMGWVAEKLCQQGQDVKGMIICKEPDPRLTYALQMAKNVSLKYYRVDFKLQDQP